MTKSRNLRGLDIKRQLGRRYSESSYPFATASHWSTYEKAGLRVISGGFLDGRLNFESLDQVDGLFGTARPIHVNLLQHEIVCSFVILGIAPEVDFS